VASCKDVCGFLGQVSSRAVTPSLPDADTARLAQLGLVRLLTADQYRDLTSQVNSLASAQATLTQESVDRNRLASELSHEFARTHSILFHLKSKASEAAEVDQEAKTRAEFQALDADFAQKQAAFNELLSARSTLDSLAPYGDRYVGLTSVGAAALRDLTVRLYRVGDADFEAYLAQAQAIDRELGALATGGAAYCAGLAAGIPAADLAYLWAISVGLAKAQPDPALGVPRFVQAYGATNALSGDPVNRLMSSEILVALPQPLEQEIPPLTQLVHDVRGLGVPSQSALGVASIVLFGRRTDGSFATDNVRAFLAQTRCYEAAALLGIVNTPADALTAKFHQLRTLFSGWGYDYSEDTELSAAYLAVSEYEPDQVSSKLAILARGLAAYLQYPLVAASILTSVATLEANETLNLVEKAYGIVGSQARGLSQAELICVAVRMVHGIRNELVGNLDATATQQPLAPGAGGIGYAPHPVFFPILVVHNAYYSTYGGISGVHPGHVHGMPSGFGGVGVG
jgi:hypothetical protein